MAGVPENKNAWKHGARSERHALPIGTYGNDYEAIYNGIRGVRRHVERYVPNRQGAEGMKIDAQVNELCAWEAARRIVQRLIAKGTEKDASPRLTSDQIVSYLATMTNAVRQRNAVLNRLLGDGAASPANDAWAQFYAQQQAQQAAQHHPASVVASEPEGTSEAVQGDVGGEAT
jgi:hypothetical protein